MSAHTYSEWRVANSDTLPTRPFILVRNVFIAGQLVRRQIGRGPFASKVSRFATEKAAQKRANELNRAALSKATGG